MGAAIDWFRGHNGIFNERWRGWEDNSEESYSLFGNYLNLGYGGNDYGKCVCVIGNNHIEAYGHGKKTLSAINLIGRNHIFYSTVFGNSSDSVSMNATTLFGENNFISLGAKSTRIHGFGLAGANFATVHGGDANVYLTMGVGYNSAVIIGNGNCDLTAVNLIGANYLYKGGDGNVNMRAFTTIGANFLVNNGHGANNMIAFNLFGANYLDKSGNGSNFMFAFSGIGLNVLRKIGNGDNHMHAYSTTGGNVLINEGDGLNIMFSGNLLLGVNFLWRKGSGSSYMTALNITGFNSLTNIGDGLNVMAAHNFYGINNLTRIGNGKNDMFAANFIGGNFLTFRGDGHSLMNAGNTIGINVFIKIGNGDNIMLAGNFYGGNLFHIEGNGNNFLLAGNQIGANIFTVMGDGDNIMSAGNGVGLNLLTRTGHGLTVMTAGNGYGLNVLTNLGDGTNVMTAGNVYGGNLFSRVGHGANVMTAGNMYGGNLFTLLGDGSNVMTAGNQYGGNLFTRMGHGTNVMTAGNQYGVNALSHGGDGTNVMTAGNQYGGNLFTRVGHGTNVMTGGNQYGGNLFTRTGNGSNVMTAGNQNGGNLLTFVGDGSNVMTAGNQHGVNVLSHRGDGANVMTAGNQYGGNMFTRMGHGPNVMTAGNQYGGNIFTSLGDGINIMTGGNQYGGNMFNHSGNGTNVMTAINKDGFNLLGRTGNGTNVMTAINSEGYNLLIHVGDGTTVMTGFNNKGGYSHIISIGNGNKFLTAMSTSKYSSNIIFSLRTKNQGEANWRDSNINSSISVSENTNIIVNYSEINKGNKASFILALSTSPEFAPNPNFSNFTNSIGQAFEKTHKNILKRFNPAELDIANPFTGVFGNQTTISKTEPLGIPDANKKYNPATQNWEIEKNGFITSGLKNFLGIDEKFSDFFSQETLANAKLSKNNIVMGGYGSDLIFTYGQRNLIFSDSWQSIFDFNIRILQGGSTSDIIITSSQIISSIGKYADFPLMISAANFKELFLPYLNISKIDGTIPEMINFRYDEEKSKFIYIRDSGFHAGTKDSDPETSALDLARYLSSYVSFRWETGMYGQLALQLKGLIELPELHRRYPIESAESTESDELNEKKEPAESKSEFRSHAYNSDVGNLADMLGLKSTHFSRNPFGQNGQLADSEFKDVLSTITPFISMLPFIDGDLKKLVSNTNKDNFQDTIDSFQNKYSSIFGKDQNGKSAGDRILSNHGDVIFSTGNTNMVFSGIGDDIVVALGAQNFIFSGNGHDKLIGIGDYTHLYGGNGDDFIFGAGDDVTINGGSGNDILVGAANSLVIASGAGDDIAIGVGAKNIISGGGGNDILIGLGALNIFNAGSGTNIVVGIGERNQYVLSGGFDFFLNLGLSNVVYSLSLNSLLFNQQGDDSFYYGGSGHSVFLTSDLNDQRKATAIQNCSYFGGSGNEFFELGGTNTNIEGGGGADIFMLTQDCSSVYVRDLTNSDGDMVMISSTINASSLCFFKVGAHLYLLHGNMNNTNNNFNIKMVIFDGWFENDNFQTSIFYDVTSNNQFIPDDYELEGIELTREYINLNSIEKSFLDIQQLSKDKSTKASKSFFEMSSKFWSKHIEIESDSIKIETNWFEEINSDQLAQINQSCFVI